MHTVIFFANLLPDGELLKSNISKSSLICMQGVYVVFFNNHFCVLDSDNLQYSYYLKHLCECVRKIQHEGACQEISIPQGKAKCCSHLSWDMPLSAIIFVYTSSGGAWYMCMVLSPILYLPADTKHVGFKLIHIRQTMRMRTTPYTYISVL